MSYILFDVGANDGSYSILELEKNKDAICFAFEPTPYLINNIKTKINERNLNDRYHLMPYAISNFIGKTAFNIAGQSDWGCSSLLEFSNNLDITWPGRTDFKVTETIDVEVITLKYFIENIIQTKIDKINYFHCDTQGSDLNVLQGMGEYIHLIEEGCVEAASSGDTQLYKNQHTIEDMKNFLIKNNFMITSTIPNDQFNNEFNIYFKKASVS